MPRFPKSAELTALAALNAAVDQYDATLADLREQLVDFAARKATLEGTLADHRSQEPPATPAFDPALLDAYASASGTAPDEGALTAAIEQYTSSRTHADRHNTQTAIYGQSIARLDQQLADAEAQVATAVEARAAAWKAFVNGAQGYLLARFRAQFIALRDDLIEPMLGLQNAKDAEHREVLGYRIGRVSSRSRMELDQLPTGDEQLLNAQRTYAHDYGPVIAQLRADIGTA